MPITSEHVGRAYPPSAPHLVTAQKIAEMARALGDDDPAYFSTEPVAPPTYPVVVSSWDQLFADPELGLRLNRVVHVEQKFEHARALHAGDEVVATTTITSVRVRGQVDMIGVESRIETTGGEPVCTMTSTLFHTREAEEGADD